MSNRRHRRTYRNNTKGGAYQRPPQKKVRSNGKHWKRVNTEVHDAMLSFGKNNKTARLSDKEFNGQVAKEIGYMFRLSGSHFKRACGALSDLYHILF